MHYAALKLNVNSEKGTVQLSVACELADMAEVLADIGTPEFRTQIMDALAAHAVGRDLGISSSHRDFAITEVHRQRNSN